jgi:murein L,D-transpeptidase YafK
MTRTSARARHAVRIAGSLVLAAAGSGSPALAAAEDFATHQNRAPRVMQARADKEAVVRKLFKTAGIDYPPTRLFLRAFKKERQIEVWAGGALGPLTLVSTYPVCATSGELGPKRRQGDMQIPEGVYRLDRFNTTSNFYLSLGVDYPNASDRILGVKGRLGGDIFIHGDCVTIGCLPLTDPLIEEVYLVALDTWLAGQKDIPVHIFPLRMVEAGLVELKEIAKVDATLWAFWQGLLPIYTAFEASHVVPRVTVDPKSGAYKVAAGGR